MDEHDKVTLLEKQVGELANKLGQLANSIPDVIELAILRYDKEKGKEGKEGFRFNWSTLMGIIAIAVSVWAVLHK